MKKEWVFEFLVKVGDEVIVGYWFGKVDENGIVYKIMVFFKMKGCYIVEEVMLAGNYKV